MKTFIISIIISFISFSSFAQGENIFNMISSNNSLGGKVYIFQSAKIQSSLNKYIKCKKDEKGCKGYRVQIYFGSGHTSREHANNIRNSFVSKHQEIPVHVVFQEPYFKVRVGDFRTKSEALKVLKTIEQEYEGAFIVKDYINFPEL